MEMHILSSADEQANHFNEFVKSLAQKFQPLQVFCFAKKCILNETDGCFINRHISHHCQYCLLVVTETSTRIDHEVQNFANTHFKSGVVTILCHGQESISEAIKANNRFFMTVYTIGQLLYSHDGMTQFNFSQRFIPTQSAKKAKKHFAQRMPLANGFLRGAAECLTNQDFNITTFMLHQVIEQSCIVLIKVHMAYRSEIHNLNRLLNLCKCFSDKPYQMLLSGSSEDERLFDILIKSYSEARYGDHFSVDESDAQQLYDKVTSFVALTNTMCKEKIQKLENEAVLYRNIPQESEVIHG
ncbi:HEPN domain-containing protein [Pedobacter cryoconitis]|uniref:HEPN domain-containing protein n=1 Tax=Pedobacter cryoconitis TaxID=188932 RepID=A0A7W9E1H1_9SPHI|nr:HEPN domain-containing protein [Pedobacter cryoconitis]MBB5639096.1 HEPN domain-containing protein [Pedobacter cryoconitis]